MKKLIGFWLLISAVVLASALAANTLRAEPVAISVDQAGTTITLYTDECSVEAVSNVKYRVTWTERGKTFEGCYSISSVGLVLMYFSEDKTVAAAPVQVFRPATGI